MSIKNIKKSINEEFYSFFKKLEITKKNNLKKDGNVVICNMISSLIMDIDKYKKKLGFYKHVQLKDQHTKELINLLGEDKSIYELAYGYLFHFFCWYVYRLISFKKFEELNIKDPTNNKYHCLVSEISNGDRIYNFIYHFTKKLIKEKNKNLIDFCKEILPIFFIVFEIILKNNKYTFLNINQDYNQGPDFYVLYKNNLNNKNYVWPIEVGGIYIDYIDKDNVTYVEYRKILGVVSRKLKLYNSYKNNSIEFFNKINTTTQKLELKLPLISLFPINKRICKYEMLRILKYIKAIASNKKDEKYTDVLEELKNTDVNKAKIRFFHFISFYCDTIIFLLSEKTNFQKTLPANTLRIKFKNDVDEYNYKNIKDLGIYAYYYTKEEKKIIKDVIKVLKYKRNILNKKDNKIKNIYCKNNGDIESIELIN